MIYLWPEACQWASQDLNPALNADLQVLCSFFCTTVMGTVSGHTQNMNTNMHIAAHTDTQKLFFVAFLTQGVLSTEEAVIANDILGACDT